MTAGKSNPARDLLQRPFNLSLFISIHFNGLLPQQLSTGPVTGKIQVQAPSGELFGDFCSLHNWMPGVTVELGLPLYFVEGNKLEDKKAHNILPSSHSALLPIPLLLLFGNFLSLL